MSTLVAEKLKEFFGGDPDLSRTDQVERLELLKSAMAESHAATQQGHVYMGFGESVREDGRPSMHIRKGLSPQAAAERFERLEKSAAGNAALMQDLQDLRGPLDPNIQKDWTSTNPIASGLVPYDLEGPAKVLVPKYTPLRNTLPRIKGQGNARQYKRITSFTNSGQASASTLPFFDSDTATSTWGPSGPITLNRPPKISYTGDNQSRSYEELGFSDQVNFKAQFQGLGFENLRALSHTAVLWSSLMGEERAILFGRGATGGGYKGIVAAPGGITTGTATTGGTLAADEFFIYVRSNQGGGLYSAVSTVASPLTTGPTP